MRLVLVGSPGAGKGTQAAVIAGKLGIPHISTGEIFRQNVVDQTVLGMQAKEYMAAGELVPDSVTNAMVADRLAQPDAAAGFLLDGYPRNHEQADVLADLLHGQSIAVDAVIEIVVDQEHILERLVERARRQHRADDTEEVVRHRFEVYHHETEPLIEYYRDRELLRTVDGVGSVDDVTARILAELPD